MSRFKSFEEFWPFYVREHSHPSNRALHFAGTSAVIALAATALVSRNARLLLALPVVGYGAAWFGHFVVEKNKPATFEYPVWSLKADFIMWAKIVAGTMDDEVARVLAAEALQHEDPDLQVNTTTSIPYEALWLHHKAMCRAGDRWG